MSLPPVKDILDSFANRDGPDFDAGTGDLEQIKGMGILGVNRPCDEFRWIAPRNLAKRTQGPKAAYEIVYFWPSIRERQRIVQKDHSGQIDLVLCVRKVA